MEFGSFDKTVGGIRITAPEMPLLVCSSCHKEDLPESTKGYVRGIVQEAKSKGTLRVNLKTNSEARAFRYNLCKDVNFSYDPMDCKIIPLLQSDFAEEGYFTPVFFEREALHKYLCFERYHVHMAGNTYGTIFRKDDWDLNFGINRNERVFCWLGDLEKIPKRDYDLFI